MGFLYTYTYAVYTVKPYINRTWHSSTLSELMFRGVYSVDLEEL